MDIGSGIAGPLLTAFVSWVLDQAHQDGARRLLFVARDGQIMLGVAQQLARPGHPKTGYLEASRRSLLLTELDVSSMAHLEQVLPPPGARSVGRSLQSLGLDLADLHVVLRTHGLSTSDLDRPVSGPMTGRLTALLRDPAVQARLQQEVDRARAAAVGYLGEHGLIGTTDWALVDVGWNLRLQAVLRRLTGRSDGKPLGYYLGARPEGVRVSQPGPHRAFAVQGEEPGGPAEVLFRQHTAVEALLTPGDSGSVHGYVRRDGRWRAVLGPAPSATALQYIRPLHAAVLHHADAVARGRLPVPERDMALAAAAGLLGAPMPEQVAALRDLSHADDVGQQVDRPLVQPLSPAFVLRLVRDRVRGRPRSPLLWRPGSLALAPRFVRFALSRR